MRVIGQFLAIAFLAAVPIPSGRSTMVDLRPMLAQGPAPAPAKDAATVLAAARQALGGEQRLSSVKNFVVTGRTRQVRGDNLVPIEFEIAFEMPDKFVRKDEIPAQESGPTSTGFNGDELIQVPVPTPPPASFPARAGGPPAPSAAQLDAMRAGRVASAKQDFVRLALGMFAGSFSTYPLTFTYAGQAEAPQAKADVLDAKGPANFAVRLFVNSETHLPIMVSWQAPTGRGGPGRPGGPGAPPSGTRPGASPSDTPPPTAAGAPPGAAPPGATPPGAAPPRAEPPGATPSGGTPGAAPPTGAGPARPAASTPPVEYRLYFADYRDVNGLQWPFRLRRATGTETTEETTFDRFRINTKIDPKKFEVRK
jgi:hypothetical protein